MVNIKDIKKVMPLVDELETIESILKNYHKMVENLLNTNNVLKLTLDISSTVVEEDEKLSKEASTLKKLKGRLQDLGVGTPLELKKKETLKKMSVDLEEVTSIKIIMILIEDLTKRKVEVQEELKSYNIN